MSNVQATIKAASQLVTSLADQGKFNSGQITYLGRELLEKPKLFENFDRILKVDQIVCVIDDTSKDDLCKSYDTQYAQIQAQASDLIETTQRILKIEDNYRTKADETLRDERREREVARQTLDASTRIKLEKLSEKLLSEELELERKFLKFEENLRNN